MWFCTESRVHWAIQMMIRERQRRIEEPLVVVGVQFKGLFRSPLLLWLGGKGKRPVHRRVIQRRSRGNNKEVGPQNKILLASLLYCLAFDEMAPNGDFISEFMSRIFATEKCRHNKRRRIDSLQ